MDWKKPLQHIPFRKSDWRRQIFPHLLFFSHIETFFFCEGGFGVVFRGFALELEKVFAVKVMLVNAKNKDLVKNEVEILKKVDPFPPSFLSLTFLS